MRRAAIALAAGGALAVQAAGLAHPQSRGFSLASIETESVAPDTKSDSPAEAGSAGSEIPATGNPLWAIPISSLSATRDRPLFSPSRRPVSPAVAAAPTPPPTVAKPIAAETPPFALVGTIIGESDRIAIFFDETSKTATGVKEGDSASGWTLRSVDPGSAVLEANGRVVTLDLPEPSAQGSSAPRISAAPRRRRFFQNNGL